MLNHPDTFQNKSKSQTIQNLYPELTPEEQSEVEHALRRYLALVWRIYQRLRREKGGKI